MSGGLQSKRKYIKFDKDKKEEIYDKNPYTSRNFKKAKKKNNNNNNNKKQKTNKKSKTLDAVKCSIKQRLLTDFWRSFEVSSATKVEWLNQFTSAQPWSSL